MSSDTKDRILDYVNRCDHSPTVREIAEALDFSPANIHRHLKALYYEGRLERNGNRMVVKR